MWFLLLTHLPSVFVIVTYLFICCLLLSFITVLILKAALPASLCIESWAKGVGVNPTIYSEWHNSPRYPSEDLELQMLGIDPETFYMQIMRFATTLQSLPYLCKIQSTSSNMKEETWDRLRFHLESMWRSCPAVQRAGPKGFPPNLFVTFPLTDDFHMPIPFMLLILDFAWDFSKLYYCLYLLK